MRIGYLLLSADPIHIGHISMASKCINDGVLDEVILCPCVQNPWKDAPIASFEQRCEMISNICQFINHCELEDIEKDLFPPYYSCNTLEALYNKYGKDENEHYIIGGVDVVDSLSSWMNYESMIKGRFGVIASLVEVRNRKLKKLPMYWSKVIFQICQAHISVVSSQRD
jgi:nicotinate (nicotinamide) nucleotide adenylyltransferase